MLIEFRTENHRSLKTEQVLTMEAGRVDGDETIPRKVPGSAKPLLPVAALYGANASGKSNVLSALAFMKNAVVNSSWRWRPDANIPVNTFAWGEGPKSSSMFEVTFVHRGVRYQYGFVANKERFVEEWLFAWPKGKKQTWFARDGMSFTFSDKLRGNHKMIEGVTRYNALFLSVAAQYDYEQVGDVFNWFLETEIPNYDPDLNSTVDQFLEFKYKRGNPPEEFHRLLSRADIGISEVRIEKVPTGRPGKSERIQYFLKHDTGSDDSWLPLEEESGGTKTLFQMAIPLLNCIQTGGRMIVDELEASLHPKLAIEIVKQFNNPKTNPKNAQLIFTTHDTNLLGNDAGEPVLRRDQVWLTEKDKEGATVLYPLTDYKPRKAENVERGYLQGRYGAIPYLGNFSLLGESAP